MGYYCSQAGLGLLATKVCTAKHCTAGALSCETPQASKPCKQSSMELTSHSTTMQAISAIDASVQVDSLGVQLEEVENTMAILKHENKICKENTLKVSQISGTC